MNQHLQSILDLIQSSVHLTNEQRTALLKSIKAADKELEITAFKLDRADKVKMTTAILLEETIRELEHKRKAVEDQNRELAIESSLERVRTVALSMNKPDHMLAVCRTIAEQLQHLEVHDIRNVQTAIFYKETGVYINYEYYAKHDKTIITEVEYKTHDMQRNFAEQMLKGANEVFTHSFKGQEVQDWLEFQKTTNVFIDSHLEKASSLDYYWYSLGPVALGLSTYKPLQEDGHKLFKRFLKVFELAYRRYLDIEKAETQAKDAQVELSLERVRARTMAMHNSADVGDTVTTMFDEVVKLGIETIRCGVGIMQDGGEMEVWTAKSDDSGKIDLIIGRLDMMMHPLLTGAYNSWKQNQQFYTYELKDDDLINYFTVINSHPGYPIKYDLASLPSRIIHNEFHFTEGTLFIFSLGELPPETLKIFKRFAGVFGQTYTRFLDLQKAEAQAKESQIQLALERARTQSMLMQHSKELDDTLRVFHEQVLLLGIHSAFSFLWLPDEKNDRHLFWAAWREGIAGSPVFKSKATNYPLDRNEPSTAQCLVDWKSNERVYSYHVPPDAVEHYFAAWQELIDGVEQLKPEYFSEGLYYVEAFMKYGCFGVMVSSDLTEGEKNILARFATEFERTYRRFLDLQKAEVQTRESQIELSLERIRAKTMAMHNSDDVAGAVTSMFDELVHLGIEKTIRCGIGIIEEPMQMEVWTAYSKPKERVGLVSGRIDLSLHQMLRGVFQSWKNNETHSSYVLTGEDGKDYYRAINDSAYSAKFDIAQLPQKQYQNAFYFREGFIYVFSTGQLAAETVHIFKRFATAFGLTYRRFLDLQHAEAQAKEATIEASLERVRSRTLAMQTSNELAETAAVLFRQLIGLGIEPNRLYIAIVKDEPGGLEFWITGEDGTRVGDKFSGNAYRNMTFQKMYEGWAAHKKSIVIDMQGDELTTYFNHLTELGIPFKPGLAQKRRVQNIAYFGKGFIGMASPDKQPEESVNLLERFAAVFNLTYTRFNDLQIAEAHAVQAAEDLVKLQTEKKRAEETLIELRETQKQLIQSEKMASLGELTAGIAHEIQNPLNFVNNFSEVSNELIDEMNMEIEKGDMAEARAIASDIKQNLEKINYHGKRADAIVKGMLQHSRASNAVREPTDINKLADEYLRLAYHGLRAKDKTFNATLKTDYDGTIGTISIIPQDIGRVILNLITNAFYVVTEKKRSGADSYEPVVSVSTKKINNKVEICITDNGNGIPSTVMEKIFQPFFTTKPTGQGTGLGLSLSYDIVKAHGGELKAETKEGEYAKFIIYLPYSP